MVLISRKVDYAILVLHDLMQVEQGASARELADRYHLSRPFIANILKELCQEGFVESQRGMHGGYRLAMPASEIRLDQIISALDGSFRLMSCAGEDTPDCDLTSVCPIRGPLKIIHERMLAALCDLTIEDLAAEPALVALTEERHEDAFTADLS